MLPLVTRNGLIYVNTLLIVLLGGLGLMFAVNFRRANDLLRERQAQDEGDSLGAGGSVDSGDSPGAGDSPDGG